MAPPEQALTSPSAAVWLSRVCQRWSAPQHGMRSAHGRGSSPGAAVLKCCGCCGSVLDGCRHTGDVGVRSMHTITPCAWAPSTGTPHIRREDCPENSTILLNFSFWPVPRHSHSVCTRHLLDVLSTSAYSSTCLQPSLSFGVSSTIPPSGDPCPHLFYDRQHSLSPSLLPAPPSPSSSCRAIQSDPGAHTPGPAPAGHQAEAAGRGRGGGPEGTQQPRRHCGGEGKEEEIGCVPVVHRSAGTGETPQGVWGSPCCRRW